MQMDKYLSIISLNMYKLNVPIKRHRADEWIRNHESHICCLEDTHLRTKETQAKSEGMGKKMFEAKGHENKELG